MAAKVLITGGAGFIGSHLSRRLLAEGREVVIVDNLSNGARANVPDGAEFIEMDISAPGAWDAVDLGEVDAVCHLAAQSSGSISFLDPDADMQSHVVATFRLLEQCRKNGISRFLYASSSTVYGEQESLPVREDARLQPTMFYSAGKIASEGYVRFYERFGIRSTILRMPNVYGPGQNLDNKLQGMISIYLSFMLEGRPILVKGGLERVRDFIYIDDVVEGWCRCLVSDFAAGKTYNLGSGVGNTVGNVLACLKQAWGDPEYQVVQEGGTPGDQSGMILDTSCIRQDLGFTAARDLASGVALMVQEERRKRFNE